MSWQLRCSAQTKIRDESTGLLKMSNWVRNDCAIIIVVQFTTKHSSEFLHRHRRYPYRVSRDAYNLLLRQTADRYLLTPRSAASPTRQVETQVNDRSPSGSTGQYEIVSPRNVVDTVQKVARLPSRTSQTAARQNAVSYRCIGDGHRHVHIH